MATEIIKVPDIGTDDKVTIIEVNVKTGDQIAAEDTMIVLESDKASMDVPAPKSGKVTQLKVAEGDEVGEGDEVLYLDVAENESTTAAPEDEDSGNDPAPAPAGNGDSTQEVRPLAVPDIGTEDAVDIIEVHVKPGDTLSVDDPIVTLESDKASMEVPATEAGEVVSVKVGDGDQVREGDQLIEIRSAATPATGHSADTRQESPSAEPANDRTETVPVPDIGTEDPVDIIEVHAAEGDTINADDPIVTLESDKASMDVPAPRGGRVVKVSVSEGDQVREGDALIDLAMAGSSQSQPDDSARPAQTAPAARDQAPTEKPSAPATQATQVAANDDDEIVRPSKPVHAGPAVRKLAREFGVDLALIKGSGPQERILKDDVATFVKTRMREPENVTAGAGIPGVPDQDFNRFGEVEEKPLSRIQQLTAANMTRNWLNVPHVTQFDEADVTDLESFRQSLKPEMDKRGVKISPLAFLVKVCAAALREFPNFNVSLKADGKHFVQKHYVHIGIAVDTPNGLVVPVIRDADRKSVWELAADITDLARRARDGKVKSNEMQGGCFTISSLGALGGTAFTPIVNAPEVAILGVSKNQVKPHWTGNTFEPRTFTPLSLSYDHRAVNGADAARFTTYLCEALQDLKRILL